MVSTETRNVAKVFLTFAGGMTLAAIVKGALFVSTALQTCFRLMLPLGILF